jgi:GT2 family glycosyltransferase
MGAIVGARPRAPAKLGHADARDSFDVVRRRVVSELEHSRTAPVAVVIVNYNGGQLLQAALAALARQTVRPRRVLVVDNASSDGSTDGLEEGFPGTEVIGLAENVGFAAANNVGVDAAADCEWVALLNPDAFPEPHWLEELVAAAAEQPSYSFFASQLLLADDPARLDGTGDVYHVSGLAFRRDHGRPVANVARPRSEVFAPCAAAAMYRRDVFLDAGGFDERYFAYLEDLDLAFRLRLAGHHCLYVPESTVLHMGSAIAGRTSDFTTFHSQRNLVWTYAKNMPSPLVWVYLPMHLLVNVTALAAYSLRGQAGVVWRAKRDAVRGLPPILAERRRLQASRRARARDLRRLMGKGAEAFTTPLLRAWETRAR